KCSQICSSGFPAFSRRHRELRHWNRFIIRRRRMEPSLLLIIASVAPSLIGMTGKLYLYFALLFGAGLLFFVQRAASHRSKRAARQLLHATVIYLPLLYLLMILDKAVLLTG